MKKHLLFFASFALLFLFSCGNQETAKTEKPYLLKVKMKETDCFRCVSGQITMRDLSDVADVEIVFNGLNDNTIDRFLQTNALEYAKQEEGFKIISDQEEYAKLNTIPSVSEGHLFDSKGNEIMVFQFRLDKPTMSRLNAIQRKGHALMQTELIALETDYNNTGIDFSVQGDFYVLTNKPMNLCQVFNSNGALVREINGNLVDPAEVFPELKALDTATVKSLKNHGFFNSKIDGAFINWNELWTSFEVSCPTIEGNSIAMYTYYQLLSYPFYDSTQKFNVIYDGRPTHTMTMAFGHSHTGDTYATTQQYDKETSNIYNQAKCDMQDGRLVLNDERPIHYPDFERQDLLWYQPILKDGLLNLYFTEYLVDIQTDTIFNLPFRYNTKVVDNGGFDIKVTQDAQLADWAFDGETLGVIYYDIVEGEKSKCHHLTWQKGQNGFTDSTITLPDVEIVSLKLALPDVVKYLTKDNKVGTLVLE